jgi:hypothetical protein
MLEPDVIDLLESGCAMLVGLVTASNKPFATRGWGLEVLDGGTRARVLVGSQDLDRLGYSNGGANSSMIAVTGCSVLTLRSTQIKGPIGTIGPADDDDMQRSLRYCNAFFDDVAVVDSIPRYLMERLIPPTLLACEFDIVEVYDQTPGPNAGAPVATRAT